MRYCSQKTTSYTLTASVPQPLPKSVSNLLDDHLARRIQRDIVATQILVLNDDRGAEMLEAVSEEFWDVCHVFSDSNPPNWKLFFGVLQDNSMWTTNPHTLQ